MNVGIGPCVLHFAPTDLADNFPRRNIFRTLISDFCPFGTLEEL